MKNHRLRRHLLKSNLFVPAFVYNRHLDSTLWDANLQLRTMPSNSLQMIVWHYIAYMQNAGLAIRDEDIAEIFLHGSTSNYYYDATSDIDICIVMDTSRLAASMPGVDIFTVTTAMKIAWMRKHKIRIYGRGVDISIVDVQHPKYGPGVYKVGPAYSLPRDVWLRRPVRIDGKEIRILRRRARDIYRRYKRLFRECYKNKMSDTYLDTFLSRLWSERRAAYDRAPLQPITPETMAFRMMRRCGVLNKIKERLDKIRNKNFTLSV